MFFFLIEELCEFFYTKFLLLYIQKYQDDTNQLFIIYYLKNTDDIKKLVI